MPVPQGKLQGYLVVAEELRSLGKDVRDKVLLQVKGKQLSWRDRVLIGFGVKMSNTFASLIQDVGKSRAEAIHHLKTLTESFIYIRWVGQDTGDIRARLVVAEGYTQKVKFFKGNPRLPGSKAVS